MRRVAVAALMGAALTGCATTPEMKMTPADSGPVGVRYSQGEAFMLSGGRRGAVMLVPLRYNGSNGQTFFRVAAFNRAGAPINFGPENVSIRLDTGAGMPVYDFDHLRHNAKAGAEAARRSAAFDRVFSEFHALAVSRDNPYRARQISYQSANEYDYRMHSIADNLRREVGRVKSAVLQTTTIDPGTYWHGGIIADQPILAPGEVRTMTATVQFAGELHRFNLFLASEGTPTPPQISLPAVTQADGQTTLHGTDATWLWNMPTLPTMSEQPKVITVTRF